MDTTNSTIDEENTPETPPPFWGHCITAACFLGFGLFLTGLAVVRLQQIIHGDSKTEGQEDVTADSVVKRFLRRHVPEQNSLVLQRFSLALLSATIFGFVYEAFRDYVYERVLHPDYSIFQYHTHMAATLLASLVGWTGLLESYCQALPQDSFRGAFVFGFLGMVIFWLEHARGKHDPVNARLHYFLALMSLFTAVTMGLSIAMTGSRNCTTALVLYFGGYVGIVWQGAWFCVIAYHLKWNLSSSEHVTVLLVFVAVGLVVVIQMVTVYLNYLLRGRKRHSQYGQVRQSEEEYAPLQTRENN